ncbi:ATP-binding protein [uncultured Paludibaculum sp.]|uniref:ATP-binding protein n=1 Tax=uncultured Paludibaculum sp. TaxID=1765020 RepID=UPI002AAC0232|nr:ATP-binding protein [uncultured Paludibaculum sp.]
MTNVPIRQPCLIVLVGPPGSGKSDWACRHGAGAVIVSQDGLIDAITPHGFDHAFRSTYAAAEEAIARAGVAAGCPVIVDRTNRTQFLRARWTRIARDAGCQAVAVVMTAGDDFCRARNRARKDHRRVSDERMERMLAAMEPVGCDEAFCAVFRDDEATLRSILEYLQQTTRKELHEYCNQAR